MFDPTALPSRRLFLGSATALGATAFFAPGALAEALTRTPPQMEGPFYPDRLPLDTDNDLIIVNNSLTPAVGEITHLTGRVLDASGNPIRNATVEIWQCDAKGVYLHSDDSGDKKNVQDKNFQGFGRFLTASSGAYYFRTIKPVAYPQRPAPHIHFKVKRGNKELLTTQCYIKGNPQNDRDGVFRGVPAGKAREAVLVAFTPVKGSKTGELAANFDIVLGVVPATD